MKSRKRRRTVLPLILCSCVMCALSFADERTVQFPENDIVGTLYVRDLHSENSWKKLADARGIFSIPKGKELKLSIFNPAKRDLGFLDSFEPNDIESLVFGNGVNDENLSHGNPHPALAAGQGAGGNGWWGFP